MIIPTLPAAVTAAKHNSNGIRLFLETRFGRDSLKTKTQYSKGSSGAVVAEKVCGVHGYELTAITTVQDEETGSREQLVVITQPEPIAFRQ